MSFRFRPPLLTLMAFGSLSLLMLATPRRCQAQTNTPTRALAGIYGPRRPQSSRQLKASYQAVLKSLHRYSSQSSQPTDLEPHLTHIAADGSQGAMLRMIRLYRHARALLEKLDRSLSGMDRKTRTILQAASRMRRTRRGLHPRDEEVIQRALELLEKRIEIKQQHRDRLLALREYLCRTFSEPATASRTRFLLKRFLIDRDPVLRHAILGAFATSKDRLAVPTLIRKLSSRDPKLRAAIHETLITITGEDLGTRRRAWYEWWEGIEDL